MPNPSEKLRKILIEYDFGPKVWKSILLQLRNAESTERKLRGAEIQIAKLRDADAKRIMSREGVQSPDFTQMERDNADLQVGIKCAEAELEKRDETIKELKMEIATKDHLIGLLREHGENEFPKPPSRLRRILGLTPRQS